MADDLSQLIPDKRVPEPPTRPATDAQVTRVAELITRARAQRFRRLRAWADGKLPAAKPDQAVRLARKLLDSFLAGGGDRFAGLGADAVNSIGGLAAVSRVESGVHDTREWLYSLVATPEAFTALQAHFDEFRPGLVAMLPQLTGDIERWTTGVDARSMMKRFGLSVSSAQAGALEAVVSEQREAVRAAIDRVIDIVRSDQAIDVMTLLSAIALDHLDSIELDDKHRRALEEAG